MITFENTFNGPRYVFGGTMQSKSCFTTRHQQICVTQPKCMQKGRLI